MQLNINITTSTSFIQRHFSNINRNRRGVFRVQFRTHQTQIRRQPIVNIRSLSTRTIQNSFRRSLVLRLLRLQILISLILRFLRRRFRAFFLSLLNRTFSLVNINHSFIQLQLKFRLKIRYIVQHRNQHTTRVSSMQHTTFKGTSQIFRMANSNSLLFQDHNKRRPRRRRRHRRYHHRIDGNGFPHTTIIPTNSTLSTLSSCQLIVFRSLAPTGHLFRLDRA